MEIEWESCFNRYLGKMVDDELSPLTDIDLSHEYWDKKQIGVYVIWSEDLNKVIYVGQGIINDRLEEHTGSKSKIKDYLDTGLRAAWAEVPENFRDGVERFLADTLDPKVGSEWPNADPNKVNIPSEIPQKE